MTDAVAVRRFAAHEWRTYRDLRLRALADAPDAFGSTLAAEQAEPDDHWSERLARGVASHTDCPLAAVAGGAAVGLAWARIEPADPTVARLYQMWVAPGARRAGIGRMLLDAAIAWARAGGVGALVLGVRCGDTPASRLYARAGFEPIGAPEPLRPGSSVLAQTVRLELAHPR